MCAACGASEPLELDCIRPQGHRHHSSGVASRASFYMRQMRAGNLQLLCSTCHAKKTAEDLGYEMSANRDNQVSYSSEEVLTENPY